MWIVVRSIDHDDRAIGFVLFATGFILPGQFEERLELIEIRFHAEESTPEIPLEGILAGKGIERLVHLFDLCLELRCRSLGLNSVASEMNGEDLRKNAKHDQEKEKENEDR